MRIDLSGIKVGEKRKIITESGKEVLLIYLGGNKVIITDSKCPHLNCDLSKYGVIIKEEFVCQCHFSHFSIKDGKVKKGPSRKDLIIYDYKFIDEKTIEIKI